MAALRWILVFVFGISVTVAILVRSSGYTGLSSENGRYFVEYRSERIETTQAEYRNLKVKSRIASGAMTTTFCSLALIILIESLRHEYRPKRMRRHE